MFIKKSKIYEIVDNIKYEIVNYNNDVYLYSIDTPNLMIIRIRKGSEIYMKGNGRHRETGPAFISKNGRKEYWLNGRQYPEIKTDEEWLIFQIIE